MANSNTDEGFVRVKVNIKPTNEKDLNLLADALTDFSGTVTKGDNSKKLAAKFRTYQKSLIPEFKQLLTDILDIGEEEAKVNVAEHFDTGGTYDSIRSYKEGDFSGYVEAGGHAVWLEFGTGVTKAGYYGELPPGIVSHGQYGEGHGADPQGWTYMGDDGKYHHTMGIPAQAFLLRAAIRMQYEARKRGYVAIVKSTEHFK